MWPFFLGNRNRLCYIRKDKKSKAFGENVKKYSLVPQTLEPGGAWSFRSEKQKEFSLVAVPPACQHSTTGPGKYLLSGRNPPPVYIIYGGEGWLYYLYILALFLFTDQEVTVHIYREEGPAEFSKPMKKHIGAAIRAKTKTLNKRTVHRKE
jgi:hypothetical protein